MGTQIRLISSLGRLRKSFVITSTANSFGASSLFGLFLLRATEFCCPRGKKANEKSYQVKTVFFWKQMKGPGPMTLDSLIGTEVMREESDIEVPD